MFPVRVISLARHADKRAAFSRRNAHVPHSFFDAVDGLELTDEKIAASGLFLPEVLGDYDRHAIGCTLSHHALWKEAAAADTPLTIAEDDAVLRHDFAERAGQVMAAMPDGWDLVLWGWNFDSILHVEPMGGVSPMVMVCDQERLRVSLEEFRKHRAPVMPLRLVKGFGLLTYTLSPAGARRMLAHCFPQKTLAVYLPLFNFHVKNINVDVSTNAHYKDTQSFVCFPPLAVSPNVRG